MGRPSDRRPGRTTERERGATMVIIALAMPVLILMTSFAVDLGRQRALRRDLQAAADVVSLDLVRLITDPATAPDGALTLTELNASLVRNDLSPVTSTAGTDGVKVEWGTWTEPAGGASCYRTIVSAPPSCFTPNVAPYNAVRVTIDDEIDYFFKPGSGGARRAAIATQGEPIGEFSIGSFGANLDSTNSALLDWLLTPLLGNPVELTAVGYQGLADASVGLQDLGAELGLASPDEVLTTEVPLADAMLAAANVLEREGGDTATVTLLRDMFGPGATAEIGQLPPIRLGDLVGAAPGEEGSALGADVNVLDLISTSAFASQCTDPADLSTCSAVNVPGLDVGLPLVDASSAVRVIQGQVSARGPVGARATTNQTQVDVSLTTGAAAVGQCQPILLGLNCLLGGLTVGLVDASVTVDATVELFQGVGEIDAIRCGDPLGLDIATRTGLYAVDLTVTVEFGNRGALGGLLGPVLGTLVLEGTTNQTDVHDLVEFNIPTDVFGETVRETGQGSVGLSAITLTAPGGTGILGTLGNLGINTTLGTVMSTLVNPLLLGLDAALLAPLTELLGVNVTGADITPLDVECEGTGVKLVE